MKRYVFVIGVAVILCSIVNEAQAPKPGPEISKLASFLGSWPMDGELKPGNLYGLPAGKLTQIERYQWLPGERFLQMNREGKGPQGDFKQMWITGYDAGTKKYIGQFFDLTGGGSATATGTNNANTWMWSTTGHTPDGKTFQERCTVTLVPNTSYTVKCDTSPVGKAWSPSFEAKATKAKS